MLRRVLEWLGLVAPRQLTFCYCPGCQHELVACPDTTWTYTDEVCGVYRCGSCGLRSRWTFAMPVPVLLEALSDPGAAAERKDRT